MSPIVFEKITSGFFKTIEGFEDDKVKEFSVSKFQHSLPSISEKHLIMFL